MQRCDCLQFRDRTLARLSGGERQRVLLAACLAQRPQLLLLDEPATFLDVDQQLHCFTLLRDEASRGAACLAVTHDINLALTFCTPADRARGSHGGARPARLAPPSTTRVAACVLGATARRTTARRLALGCGTR